MRVAGEMWCVVVKENNVDDAYTALFTDRDSAEEWIVNHMTDNFADYAECGDDEEKEENEKFLAMKTLGGKLVHSARIFGTSYEIVLRDIMARETAVTQLALAVETASEEGDKT